MKQIQPIQYTNGPAMATQLVVTVTGDDGVSTCTFNWLLNDSTGQYVDNGVLPPLTGDDYTNYQADTTGMFPYTYVAANLDNPLTLITE